MNNIITSYLNPDTDGVACMIALSEIMEGYRAVILGTISAETSYVLKNVGLSIPESIDNWDDVNNIILVDTHHVIQLGHNFPVEKVSLIIDHHPAGDDSVFNNAIIDNRRIGAAASIVGEMLLEKKITGRIARLLQFAIVSNTLNFTAPSTSAFDFNVYKHLAEIEPVNENEYAEMFRSRSFSGRNYLDFILSDMKLFRTTAGLICISQVEEYDLTVNTIELRNELNRIRIEKGLVFSVFNGVDISSKRSIVVFSDGISDDQIMRLFGFEAHDGLFESDHILLRKTDFIPKLSQ